MRRHNRALVLKALVHNGSMQRPALANATGLTQATISRITDELLRGGLLREVDGRRQEKPTVGRTPATLSIDPSGGYVLALHLGAKLAQLTIADLDGQIRPVELVEFRPSQRAEPQLRSLCRRLLQRAAAEGVPPHRLRGIGVGSSGVVDPTGVIVSHPWLGWEEVPVRAILEDEAGLPVFTDSSVRAVANAEAWFGKRRDIEPLTVLLVGNVVAAATVVRGSSILGATLTEGQIGHLTVGGSRPCACGRVGCLEAELRTEAFQEKAVELGIATDRDRAPDSVVRHAAGGDERALRLLRERGTMIARGVAAIDAVVNPGAVLLTGSGFGEASSDHFQVGFAREALGDYLVLPNVRPAPSLEPGSFLPSSPMGAASLALSAVFETGAL